MGHGKKVAEGAQGGETNNTFHELVKIVDDLEVSSRLNI